MKEIHAKLASLPSDVQIVCQPCWGDRSERSSVTAHNIFSSPIDEEETESLCSEHAALLKFSNGFNLFHREYQFDSFEMEVGLRFFSLTDARHYLDDMKERRSKVADDQGWLDNYLPLAEPISSGDAYMISLSTCEVYYFDHELLFAPDFEPSFFSSSISEFLDAVLDSPTTFLRRYWRHYEDVMNQWVPVDGSEKP